jgi:hypothetical protein
MKMFSILCMMTGSIDSLNKPEQHKLSVVSVRVYSDNEVIALMQTIAVWWTGVQYDIISIEDEQTWHGGI